MARIYWVLTGIVCAIFIHERYICLIYKKFCFKNNTLWEISLIKQRFMSSLTVNLKFTIEQRHNVTRLLYMLHRLINVFIDSCLNMSRVMRKQDFCKCENKNADQLRGSRKADHRFCFRYTDSTIPLLRKSEFSSI